jgi:hypothetical protein
MIFMGTQWIPYNKIEEWQKIFLKVAGKTLPPGIKKWQVFGCDDGVCGLKGYNLIFTEKGKVDEATIEIVKQIMPFYEIEGFGWKLEPLMSMSDALTLLGKK